MSLSLHDFVHSLFCYRNLLPKHKPNFFLFFSPHNELSIPKKSKYSFSLSRDNDKFSPMGGDSIFSPTSSLLTASNGIISPGMGNQNNNNLKEITTSTSLAPRRKYKYSYSREEKTPSLQTIKQK